MHAAKPVGALPAQTLSALPPDSSHQRTASFDSCAPSVTTDAVHAALGGIVGTAMYAGIGIAVGSGAQNSPLTATDVEAPVHAEAALPDAICSVPVSQPTGPPTVHEHEHAPAPAEPPVTPS